MHTLSELKQTVVPSNESNELVVGLDALRKELAEFLHDTRSQLRAISMPRAERFEERAGPEPTSVVATNEACAVQEPGGDASDNPLERLQHIKQQLAARLGCE